MVGSKYRYTQLPSLLVIVMLLIAACNLTSAPQEQLELTDVPTNTIPPTRTPINNSSAPTPITVTSLPVFPTRIVAQRPTVILPPTTVFFPSPTPLPVSIVILSPVPGNTVAGNVQVLGAATHPNFLQYQLEWGPDPNGGNLWFPASGVVQTPVLNGLLGIWNTNGIQDGTYQLRLRVFLRDGTSLATVVNAIRIQNQIPTLIPTATTIPRPIAAFSQDRVSGQAPLVVRFINQSSGNITSYSWNFGDGGSNAGINPSHTFRNPGIYTVQLSVRGPGGESNVSRQISVQSATPPVAGFTQDKTSGPSPLTVKFTDQSQGNVAQRTWNFGDGETSNETSPSHTFNAVGTYNVILTASGPGGSSSVTRQITVENPTVPEPIAALVVSQSEGDAPLTVQFDATDSSGQIDSYNWDFGDGQLANGQIVTHTYQNAGSYEASLIVVGPGGQSRARTTITVTKPPDAPTAQITADPVSGDAPLTVQFDATGSTGPIDNYTWDFGDGTVGSGATTQHVFETGTYAVELLVEGPGGTDTSLVEITAVEPIQPPQAAFESAPASGPAPLEIQFTNQSTGDQLTFSWNFGDGSPDVADRDPIHNFEDPGDYEVVLTVTGPGGSDEARQTITVTQPSAPPTASFNAFPESGPAELTVQFTNLTAGDDLTFAWDFGDSATSTESDPQHVYTNEGQYTVTLTVTDANGRSGTTDMTILVDPPVPAPDAAFDVNPPSGEAPLTVQFDSTGGASNIDSYFWEFGDAGTSIDPDPQHIYTQAGNYTVRLTVTGAGGETSSEAQVAVSDAVVIAPPVAGFSANPPTGTANEAVQFTNTTTGDATAFAWDFGDGQSSTERDPAHAFANPGDYTVTLTASGPGGDNTVQQPLTVVAPAQPPVAGFSANPPTGTANEAVQFTNTTTGDATAFAWDFGDGQTSTERDPAHTFANPGDYTVTLTASGPGGDNTVQQPLTVVAPAQPPVAGFSANPPTGTANEAVQFTNTTTGDATAFAWDFGDGQSSTERDPAHAFANPGDYTVTLTASGPGGDNTVQQPLTVVAPAQPPVAGFSANPPTGTANEAVQFTNTTTGDATAFAWDFGDGQTSTERDPAHTFANPGDYTVTLTASGPGGDNTVQQPLTVVAPAQPPVAGFSANPPTGTANEAVQFTNTTTGDATAFAWDFGDGQSSTERDPAHTFANPGDYTVTLTASGPGGDNTVQQPLTVVAPGTAARGWLHRQPAHRHGQ